METFQTYFGAFGLAVVELLHYVNNFGGIQLGFELSNHDHVLQVCRVRGSLGKCLNSRSILTVLHYDSLAQVECRRSLEEDGSLFQAEIKVISRGSSYLH